MVVTLVSGNRHKFEEIKKIFSQYGIELAWVKASLEEKEGFSLKETAREKARQAFEIVKAPVITEDTGVFFEAFKNFPGSRAKRAWEELGFSGLLEKVSGESRHARFETIICYTADGRNIHCFKGELKGSLTEEVHNPEKDVLPYEKIFIPHGLKTTMSSISRREKNRFSHRAIAAKKFLEWLKYTNGSRHVSIPAKTSRLEKNIKEKAKQ